VIDTSVSNAIDIFVSRYAGSAESNNPLNDSLITITQRDLWDVMNNTITDPVFSTTMQNLTEALALCFAEYGKSNGRHLPMPAALDLNGGDYRRSADYDDGSNFDNGFSGRLPYSVQHSNTQLTSLDANNIYSNAYCSALLTTTATPIAVNLTGGEYFELWSNWKDYFFYAVSKEYTPKGDANPCSGNCVRVNGVDYAAVIFFSGLKRTTSSGLVQQRYGPPFDVDDKKNVVNYLESDNSSKFPDNSGKANYKTFEIINGNSNDIMYCIKQDMSVIPCP